MRTLTHWLCTVTFLICPAQVIQAQVITSTEIERGLSISGPNTNGYEPFSHRYFYGTGPYIYLNGNSQQLRYLDYLDRADRAEKFGYRMPADPFEPPPPPPAMQAAPVLRGHVGGGFGFFRRR